jgi:protocatechuate 3,4-dioxygenase beta subunit
MNATIFLLCAVLRIASASEPGERLVLTGHVLGADGKPRGGVAIEVWHTDVTGHYRRDNGDGPARLRGIVRTDPDGSYRIETIKPGLYPGANRGAHMHFKINGGQTETLFIDGGKPLLQLTRDAHGVWHAAYDFHLAGETR